MVGSLFGIVLANKTAIVKTTYTAIAMKMQLARGPQYEMTAEVGSAKMAEEDEDLIKIEGET